MCQFQQKCWCISQHNALRVIRATDLAASTSKNPHQINIPGSNRLTDSHRSLLHLCSFSVQHTASSLSQQIWPDHFWSPLLALITSNNQHVHPSILPLHLHIEKMFVVNELRCLTRKNNLTLVFLRGFELHIFNHNVKKRRSVDEHIDASPLSAFCLFFYFLLNSSGSVPLLSYLVGLCCRSQLFSVKISKTLKKKRLKWEWIFIKLLKHDCKRMLMLLRFGWMWNYLLTSCQHGTKVLM